MIFINLTYGFGNNLFQFHFGRIISTQLNLKFSCVGKVSIHFNKYKGEIPLKYIVIRDNNKIGKKKKLAELIEEISKNKHLDILLLGFFEYRDFFLNHRDEIINFHKINNFIFQNNSFKINRNLNIIHVRLNNRLVSLNHSLNWLDPKKIFYYLFNNFPNIHKWHIVSDFNFFSSNIKKDILNLRNELSDGPNKFSFLINIDYSMEYALSWVEEINKNKDKLIFDSSNFNSSNNYLDSSGGLRDNFLSDFNYLMSSENIMFWGSTFSWWASFLSQKSNIIIGSPWRLDRKPEYDPSLDKIKLSSVSRINIEQFRYTYHKKNSLIINLYDKVPFSIRGLYSKIRNYINKKIGSIF